MTPETNAPDKPVEQENKPEHPKDARPWIKMIEGAEKVFEPWNRTCDNLQKAYANIKKLAEARVDREFQMLYANLEVLKPSIYARAPQPVVVQRFKDSGQRHMVARKAGEMLERALISSFDIEKCHDTLKRVRDDLALTGRGQMWLRYEAYRKNGEMKECVRYEWIHRHDFLHEPARIWSEVGWVARGVWLTDEQGRERFGDEWQTAKITFDYAADTSEDYKFEKKARVWEIWHRDDNVVVWVHPNCEDVLDIQEPHLLLDGFFPCPRPAYATCEPDSLVPVPDACFYKDQLEEIDELTARISALSESLRLVGFYAAGSEDLGEAIEVALKSISAGENRRVAVPLPGMSSFQGGALKDSIIWLPIAEVATTVRELIALRRELMNDVREISGVSDIMRGESDPNETLGAQQMKSQYGSIRIKDRQGEMVAIADGALNIAGEIMAENFSPKTLILMSQTDDIPKQADVLAKHNEAAQQEIQAALQQAMQGRQQQGQQPQGQPGQPGPQPQPGPQIDPNMIQQAKQAIILKHQQEAAKVVTQEAIFALLREQRLRPFVLQVATDSTIQPDENAEKAARAEFGTAFAQVTASLGPLLQADPQTAPFAGEMLKFMLAPFRAGRQMDQSIDDFVEKATQKAMEPPPPNPEAEAMRADVEMKKADLEDRKASREAQQQKAMADAAMSAQRQQAETAAKEREAALRAQQDQRDAMIKDAEVRARVLEIERKAEADRERQVHEREMRELERELKLIDREIAEIKLDQVKAKPAPQPNGNGEARS